MRFRWHAWNIAHVAEHGVTPPEAEQVVRRARKPWPERRSDGKWRVIGPTDVGRLLQVVFVVDPDRTIHVIHARDLTDSEKHQYRRRKR